MGHNIWPLVIMLLIPALSWIAQRLKEQALIKQERDNQARRREEELRTGRTTGAAPARPTTAASGSQSADAQAVQDLAARRQAQLRELRARQMQQGQASQGPPVIIPSPQQPTRRPPMQPSAGPLRPTPMPGGPRPAQVQRPAPRSPQPRRPEPTPSGSMPLPARLAPIAVVKPAAPAPEIIASVPSRHVNASERLLSLINNRATGKPDAARLIVLGEILGTPPSLRS